MLDLAICISLNVAVFVILRLFASFRVDALQAIVWNYLVCAVTGCLFMNDLPSSATVLHAPWLPLAALTGCLFISVFNLMAQSARVDGLTTTTIANKLSIIIPFAASIALYKEHVSFLQGAGIVIALPAIYLTASIRDEQRKKQNLLLPLLIFTGSGLLDALLKYAQYRFVSSAHDQALYATCAFATAAAIGLIVVPIFIIAGRQQFHWRNMLAGICLGIPNYFSIYFFERMLNNGFMESSAAIPVNNIGILVLCSVAAMIFFGEKASLKRIAGLLLSILAISLIAFGGLGT